MGERGWRRWAAVAAVAVLVGACDSTPPVTLSPSVAPTPTAAASAASPPTPAPTPTATPSPAPTTTPVPSPTSSPAAQAWPYRATDSIVGTLFHDDGSVVVVERDFNADRASVMTLDAAGQPLGGWPWSPDGGGSVSVAALGPDGSIYVAARGLQSADFDFTWSLHRLSSEAQELTGFPVRLPNASFCDLKASRAGVAYMTCETSDDNGDVTGTSINAVNPDGSAAFAAPVSFKTDASLIGFGNDNLPVLSIAGAKRMVVRKLSADGSTRWSRASIAGSAELDTAGRVRVTDQEFGPDACGTPLRTRYDLLAADGTRPAGWPVTVAGWASAPAVLQDGSAVVVTASGRAIRYTLRGSIAAGWPVRGIEVSFGCFDGTTPVSDGHRAVVVGPQRVTVLRPSGRIPTGWPANPPGKNANACPDCTPGSGAMIEPVLADGPMTYVATYGVNDRPRVAAIGADGAVENLVVVGERYAQILMLDEGPTGRIWAVTEQATNDTQLDTLWLVADPPAAP